MYRPLALLGLLALAACTASVPTHQSSEGDAGSVVDAGQPTQDAGVEITLPDQPTLQQLVDWWNAKVACRLYSCEQRVRETPATCTLAQQADGIPYDTFRQTLASVTAGRATYDAAAGARCGTWLRHLDLSGECFGQGIVTFRQLYGPGFVSNCLDLMTGTVAQGGVCSNDLECVTGGGCVFNRTSDCSGQCVVWLKAGESCSSRSQDCVDGTYCDGTVCKAKALSNDGATCYDQGESCRSGKCFDYQCKSVSALNGECIAEGDCASGLYCRPLPPSTGLQGVCKAQVPAGQPCGYLDHCNGNQSCDGYFWAYQASWVGGTCGDKPNNVGDSCVPIASGYDYGDTGCFNDLSCDPTTSKCVEAPAIGTACAMPGARCGFEAYCDASALCQPKKGPGEAAMGPAECRDQYDSFQHQCYRQTDRDRCGQL
jgi:hypothetical protein